MITEEKRASKRSNRRQKPRSHSKNSRDLTPTLNNRKSPEQEETESVSTSSSPIPQEAGESQEEFIMSFTETAIDSGLDDTNLVEEDRLRLKNSRLQGRLSIVGSEAQNWLREKSHLSAEVSALRGHLSCSKSACEEAMTRSEELAKELMYAQQNFKKQVENLTQRLDLKTQTVDKLSDELKSSREEHVQLKVMLEKRHEINLSQDKSVIDLKKKIAELFTEVDQLREVNFKMKDENCDLTEQLRGLKDTKEWYADQLSLTRSSREQIETELKRMVGKLKQGSELNHSLSHENACLQSQLVVHKASLIDAKRSMSLQLDQLRVKMLEREAAFEKLLHDRDSFAQLSASNKQQLEESREQLQSVTGHYDRLKLEFEQLGEVHEEALCKISEAEKSQVEFKERLAQLEDQLADQSALVAEHQQSHDELLAQISLLEVNSQNDKALLETTREQLEDLRVVLKQAEEDKDALQSYLDLAKENLQKISVELEKTKEELSESSLQLSTLNDKNKEIEHQNEELRAQLIEKDAELEAIVAEKASLDEVLLQVQLENQNLQEELVQFKQESLRVQEEIREEFAKQLQDISVKHEEEKGALVATIQEHLNQIQLLNLQVDELCSLRENYQNLVREHESLSQVHEQLKADAEGVKAEFTQCRVALNREIENLQDRYSQDQNLKQTEIDRLQSERGEYLQDIEHLRVEIENLHVAKLSALQEQEADWSAQLADAEQRLTASESKKILLETELQEMQLQTEKASKNFAAELEALRDQLAVLEGENARRMELEERHKELLMDMETRKGQQVGMQQAYETLKKHSEFLEQCLEEKESSLAEIQSRVEIQDRKSNFSRGLMERQEEEEIKPVSAILVQSAPEETVSKHTFESLLLEKDRLAQSVSEAIHEATELSAELQVLKVEHQACSQTIERLDETRDALLIDKTKLTQELSSAKLQLEQLKMKNQDLMVKLNEANESGAGDLSDRFTDYTRELETLRKIIKATTDHVAQLNARVEMLDGEKRRAEGDLWSLRGAIQGLLETEKVSAEGTITISIESLKSLVDMDQSVFAKNKPIIMLDEYLGDLQSEINQLESEIVTHNMTVHDSVDFWKGLHEESNQCPLEMSN